jgi:murein L,D-transpeptidase YcbB/YkuD
VFRVTICVALALLALLHGGCAPAAGAATGWVRNGAPTPQALAMMRVLRGADEFGLRPQDYQGTWSSSPITLSGGEGAEAVAQFDESLSGSVAHFLHDVHFGRVDPHAAGFNLGTPRPPLNVATLFSQLQTTDDVGRVIASLEPQFLHYELLKEALARYRLLAAGAATPTPEEARSAPFAHCIRQIELTLERWRWLPAFDTPPIIVNIPQFRLFAFRSTQDRKSQILQMDVIVGRTFLRTQTPVFVADMRYLIFRPYWDVPYSITQREMLPAIRANPNYLAHEHLEIVNGPGDNAPVMQASPEAIAALAAGTLRLRQRPGADNALGLVKFMLPNPYNVYLHSTPAHQLFLRSRRAFSHGCIRVSDPVALATLVLGNSAGQWTSQAVQSAMNGPDDVRVRLERPVRVLILYGTALATEDGQVLFFDDLYGHDRKLEKLLGLAPVPVH